MACDEVDPDTGRICVKDPCFITHEAADGWTWGISEPMPEKKSGSTRDRAKQIIGEGINMQKPTGPPNVDEVKNPPVQFRRNSDPLNSHEAIEAYYQTLGPKKREVFEYLRSRPGVWVDSATLHGEVGGLAGDRRLRELRKDGAPIETRRVTGTNTWQHRWFLASSDAAAS